MIAIALLALTLTIILDSAQGIYFHVVQGQDRCFIEEVCSTFKLFITFHISFLIFYYVFANCQSFMMHSLSIGAVGDTYCRLVQKSRLSSRQQF